MQAIAGKDYGYAYNGLDWVNDFETCRGSKQSPVLLTSIGEAGWHWALLWRLHGAAANMCIMLYALQWQCLG